MALAAGTRFNQYEILAPLGAGGMGEVYRARDERLAREVAIKVLPAELAKDADRLKRFEQEARAISALNHPNILTVYDFGTHAGNPYLVMELLKGEELRAQITAGALPVRKALEYAQQIASGLAAAHAKGIIHRDLKPENLFVTKDGRVKILDFGLVKLKPQQLTGDLTSKTETLTLLTNPGVVMGTVGYMAPEQMRGQEVDQRADIFSFGIILYEMLAGRRPFTGGSPIELMHAMLKDDPPALSAPPAQVSPQLETLVRRCLEKEPEHRFHSAQDLGFALEALSMPSATGPTSSDPYRTAVGPALEPAKTAQRGGWRGHIWKLAAGVLALLALALGVAYFQRPALEAEPLHFAITPPTNAKLFDWPTISPDGRTLAFIAEVDGKTQLWVRPLGATTARPLVEVRDNQLLPFWSPDSQFIAYFELPKLKKIALAGGTPETLCEAPLNGGGTWNREGIILLGSGATGIRRVSASGGAVTAVTNVDTARGDISHFAPTFLPDGRHFLYWINNPDSAKSGIYLASLDGGEPKRLMSVDARNVEVALHPADQSAGYLAFVRQGALLAQAFDFSRNELRGNPVRLAEQVAAPVGRWARFSLARNGLLCLLESEPEQRLTWFEPTGKKLGTVGSAGQYAAPGISPTGQQLALTRTNPPAQFGDIHLFDLASGAGTPFTFDPKQDEFPLWSPDGNRLVWSSWREGTAHLFQKAASGVGQDEVLLRSAYTKRAVDWSTDGRFILYSEGNPQTSADLWVLPMEGERKPWVWLNTPANESPATFSPDGKWIAYQSNESGRNEIYLQAFVPGVPASGGKRQLSTNGGLKPYWRRDGRELYYVAPDGKLLAVPITPGAELKAGTPTELFAPSGFRVNADRGYTLTGDGQRFLFVTSADEASVPPFTVVLNWMAEVKQ